MENCLALKAVEAFHDSPESVCLNRGGRRDKLTREEGVARGVAFGGNLLRLQDGQWVLRRWCDGCRVMVGIRTVRLTIRPVG